MSDAASSKEAWHVDKKVPAALILTIALQTMGAVWWAAGMDARVAQHDREIKALTQNDGQMQGEARRIAEMLSRLEERIAGQTALLQRVEQAVRSR